MAFDYAAIIAAAPTPAQIKATAIWGMMQRTFGGVTLVMNGRSIGRGSQEDCERLYEFGCKLENIESGDSSQIALLEMKSPNY